jgi:DNA helicase-2/ATP-dependent DNA helicase PcrA
VKLEQNYRSTAPILALANAAIRHNTSRWEKSLWTERGGGRKPELFLAGDEDEEAEEVARRVARAASTGGGRLGDIAVFYRTHAQSRPFEDAFLRSQIPYVLVGGVYFYQRKEVKDLLSYLRVLANPSDRVSLERALSAPRRGIGEQSVAALFAAAAAQGADPLAIAASGPVPGVRGKAGEQLLTFARAMLAWRARLAEPPELILSEIITAVEYKGYLEQQGEDWEERAANVEELLAGARLYSSTHGGGVPEYLDQVSLLTDLDSLKENNGHVTLMTAHNAKGLEFPRVFVTGLEEGLFPHISALDDKAEMEEERRLFYVACTRAMDELTLSACLMRRRFNAAAGGVSRFVGEIEPGLYEETDLGSAAWSGPARRRARGQEPSTGERRDTARSRGRGGEAPTRDAVETGAQSDDLDHPLVGRRVFHATFGPGIVVGAEGRGVGARVTVRFHSGTTRKLVSSYLEWEP